jgi:hypothetical protein
MDPSVTSSPHNVQVAALARRIRDAQQAIEDAQQGLRRDRREKLCSMLHSALDAGDALVTVQDLTVGCSWSRWLRENCCMSRRTALVYMQLSRHREEIEAAIDAGKCLSLRAALRLVTGAEPGPRQTKNKPDLSTYSDAELVAEIDGRGGANWLLKAVLPDLREQLEARLAGQLKAQKRKPSKPKPFKSKVTGRPIPTYEPERADHYPIDPNVIEAAGRETLARWEKDRTRGRRVFPTIN